MLKQSVELGLILRYVLVVLRSDRLIPLNQVRSASLDAVPKLVSGDADKVGLGCDVDIDRARLRWDVDAVELVKCAVRWRNWSNVSPEGSLNFFPDSRKIVRQGNRFISVSPRFAETIFYQGIVQRLRGLDRCGVSAGDGGDVGFGAGGVGLHAAVGRTLQNARWLQSAACPSTNRFKYTSPILSSLAFNNGLGNTKAR